MLSMVKLILKSIWKYNPKNKTEFWKKNSTVSLGNIAWVPIPDIDKGQGDSHNIQSAKI